MSDDGRERIGTQPAGKHLEYVEPETLPPLPSVEYAIARVDSWGKSEANTTGLHMIARALREEIRRLQGGRRDRGSAGRAAPVRGKVSRRDARR